MTKVAKTAKKVVSSLERKLTLAAKTAAAVIKTSRSSKARRARCTEGSVPEPDVQTQQKTSAVIGPHSCPAGFWRVALSLVKVLYSWTPATRHARPELAAIAHSVSRLTRNHGLGILSGLRYVFRVNPVHIVHYPKLVVPLLTQNLPLLTQNLPSQVESSSDQVHSVEKDGWDQRSESDFVPDCSHEELDVVDRPSSVDGSDRFQNTEPVGDDKVPAPRQGSSRSWADMDDDDDDVFWDRPVVWKNELPVFKPKTARCISPERDDKEPRHTSITCASNVPVDASSDGGNASSARDKQNRRRAEDVSWTEKSSYIMSSGDDTASPSTSTTSGTQGIGRQASLVAKQASYEARVEAARRSALRHNLAVGKVHGSSCLANVSACHSGDEVLSPVQHVNRVQADVDVNIELTPFLSPTEVVSGRVLERAARIFAMYILQKSATQEMVDRYSSSRETAWRETIAWINLWESYASRFPEYLGLRDDVEETRLARVLEWWRYDDDYAVDEAEDQETVYPEGHET